MLVNEEQQTEIFTNEFNKAIAEEQFALYLQAKFNTHINIVYDAEITIKWNHPTKGLLNPIDFMPQLNDAHLMPTLDCYVWEQACKLLSRWKDTTNKDSHLALKISNESLHDDKTIKALIEIVKKYQIKENLLQIEIEESYINTDIIKAAKVLEVLKQAGFAIIIDDSMHGCSSISILNQVFVDAYKVDMNYFFTESKENIGRILLSSVINTLNKLNITVIAECIETKEQNDFAISAGSNYLQGFYHSNPLSIDEYEKKFLQTEENTKLQELYDSYEKNDKQTIVIIDDMEIERTLLECYLSPSFNVIKCDSVPNALLYLEKNSNTVDLILVDYIMPDMTGLDFLQYCKLHENLDSIPKIMITADDCAEHQVVAFNLGACDYIMKPLYPELIRIRIKNTLALYKKIKNAELENEELHHQIQIDKLTGLLNKISFQNLVEKLISRNKENNSTLMILDVDDFKSVNDNFGHLTGDLVIQLIAAELKECFRNTDLISRFGGDEFTIFISGKVDKSVIERKAAEIIERIKIKTKLEFGFYTSSSIGIGFSKKNEALKDLFERTDTALYHAKNSGKGKAAIAS